VSNYQRRIIDELLDDYLLGFAAVALDGPKSVGKTATATQRARTVFRLDESIEAERLRADWGQLVTSRTPVLLDEWQRLPECWDRVRRAVDDGAAPGAFLLTGSAVPIRANIHSGAGRIDRLRLRPLSLAERRLAEPTVSLHSLFCEGDVKVQGHTKLNVNDYSKEIASSGLPAIRSLPPRLRKIRIAGYLESMVNREFPQQGLTVRRPQTLRNWMTAFAKATGTNATYSTIIADATTGEGDQPTKTTTIAYRDILQSLWMLDEVPAWDPGSAPVGRLSTTPKHFLADPALAVSLMNLDEGALTKPLPPGRYSRYGSLAGRLFEALVGLSLQTYAAANDANVFYLRDRNGDKEVDFIIQQGQSVIAVEVKLASDVHSDDVRHLVWLRDRIGSDFAAGLLINTGQDAYRRADDGILVLPAALLGP
jgi:predicted AAA+ superfamily ATPase